MVKLAYSLPEYISGLSGRENIQDDEYPGSSKTVFIKTKIVRIHI